MAMCVPKIHGATKVYREIPIPGMGKVETSKYNDNVFNTNYGFLALILCYLCFKNHCQTSEIINLWAYSTIA